MIPGLRRYRLKLSQNRNFPLPRVLLNETNVFFMVVWCKCGCLSSSATVSIQHCASRRRRPQAWRRRVCLLLCRCTAGARLREFFRLDGWHRCCWRRRHGRRCDKMTRQKMMLKKFSSGGGGVFLMLLRCQSSVSGLHCAAYANTTRKSVQRQRRRSNVRGGGGR